ncbi:MAG: trypsin-like peptidase domain-containing protein, partial [Verrucomicrobia bacterium]|nr:trypsin-like peptidase domain-containing protein [Cytophagales bacterium]
MNRKQLIVSLLLASVFGGLIAVAGFSIFGNKKNELSFAEKQQSFFKPTNFSEEDTTYQVPQGLNFTQAAELVRHAVVHIKISDNHTSDVKEGELGEMFHNFHSFPHRSPKESAGSGVIISADGYIATNNHVVEGGGKIEVVLEDKRSFTGTVIGTDPTTDLALVKIEENNLPFVPYGNSDRLRIGEWVLAIGNPFDLTSTVTAGIVSAKGRNINILKDKDNMQIESFIQTDAAVNPGNSGGALVDLKGRLVGINTAIATNTGFYAGYSFAVPVTLVKKVMDDLLRYGNVQRALLGVAIQDVDAELANDKNLSTVKGVYIKGVNENSAAKQAGLQTGDVIVSINNNILNSTSELQAFVATFRPGDKILVSYEREGKLLTTSVLLKNIAGQTAISKKTNSVGNEVMGAVLQAISGYEKEKLSLAHGVKIIKLGAGKIKEA